ncbi:flagellar hook-basal body complex protein FliE [Aquabacter spiritensis]|uniref:Flagellar hook-basal body complex protein FliE n=1 Tax=Aquabacter spiritensis TaxID=933073 RepID=A0A4R3M4G5_9HYPH|nr:flagellar hook-basal body complex protein FliE [Aquabacter spiritensis]TCT07932.1 flagellar hook-basal body complex protein FliE [Aquabacter spiritensis]
MIDAISSFSSQVRGPGLSGAASTASTAPAAGATGAASFGDVLAEVSSGAVSTLKAGEAAAISGIEGKASVQRVVEAIMSAEQTLQTAVAVRDKVVSAYQEISRMAI